MIEEIIDKIKRKEYIYLCVVKLNVIFSKKIPEMCLLIDLRTVTTLPALQVNRSCLI